MPEFTVETARQAGLKSVQVRRERAIERARIPIVSPVNPVEVIADPFCEALACACGETLKKLREATEPIHRAQLARALRDLRETWHLATGKPRPGLTRPDLAMKQPRPRMPSVYPTVYPPTPTDPNLPSSSG